MILLQDFISNFITFVHDAAADVDDQARGKRKDCVVVVLTPLATAIGIYALIKSPAWIVWEFRSQVSCNDPGPGHHNSIS